VLIAFERGVDKFGSERKLCEFVPVVVRLTMPLSCRLESSDSDGVYLGHVGKMMMHTGKMVRVETEDDFNAAIATLVMAFTIDPVARWMYHGKPQAYLAGFPPLMRALGESCRRAGTVFSTPDRTAVALWMPPEAPSDDEALVRVVAETIPANLQEEVGTLFEWTDQHRPMQPFWYLSLIGVEPGATGQGRGSALIEQGLRLVDASHSPAYLWASNPANVPLYQRHGFATVASTRIGSSPEIFAMLRSAT
jgi:GNAT superfamily N-acetyltransferase